MSSFCDLLIKRRATNPSRTSTVQEQYTGDQLRHKLSPELPQ